MADHARLVDRSDPRRARARRARSAPAALLFLLRRSRRRPRRPRRAARRRARPRARPAGPAWVRRRLERRACDWLALFSEAAIISDDPRLPRAAADLLAGVRARWSELRRTDRSAGVDEVMRAVEACLLVGECPGSARAGGRGDRRARARRRRRLPAGPGHVASRSRRRLSSEAASRDQVRSASTLLTAYMLTARLPYAMLADELMQSVVRTRRQSERDVPFAVTCEVARVFCRLAALHHDEEYRRTAVLAVDDRLRCAKRRERWTRWRRRCANWASTRRLSVSHSPNGSKSDEIADFRFLIAD